MARKASSAIAHPLGRRNSDHGPGRSGQTSSSQNHKTQHRDSVTRTVESVTTPTPTQLQHRRLSVCLSQHEKYTRDEQRSPNRKRGRAPVLGRTTLTSRTSLDDVLSSSPVEVAKLLMDAGFLSCEPPSAGSCKCEEAGRWKLEEQGLGCFWRCKGCRKTFAVTRLEDELILEVDLLSGL